jgi:hypothetical protein
MAFEFNLKDRGRGTVAAMAMTLLVSAFLVSLTASAQIQNEFRCRLAKTPRMPTFRFRRQYGPEIRCM